VILFGSNCLFGRVWGLRLSRLTDSLVAWLKFSNEKELHQMGKYGHNEFFCLLGSCSSLFPQSGGLFLLLIVYQRHTAKNPDVCKPLFNKILSYYEKVCSGFFVKPEGFLIKN